ncbi:CNNM domain-containing protein [Brumimicrobium aurantiacum]|uniref:HlyC/CorC family transporter n=1 Tax=Brumimicrobium aurantiacum TaxID=1737063 RepID=A0A3E1EUZ2_9FLAO|nr:hemolysin family protein [Brumimicrobium aurantiacum]RFC53360.1 HlyC/CorC family transporter [Brumimicrobium aurantiacum]
MIALLVYLFIALFVSFLCSIMESVLLSVPQSYLIVKHESGKEWAKSFMDLKINIDKPLSAILTLNTVAHTIGAAGVGAQAVKVFGEASFGVVSAVLTFLILFVTEIIPKTIGARYWRKLTKSVYNLIKITVFLTYPFVLLSALVTKLFSKKDSENTTSREEIAALAKIGMDEGLFSSKENKIIQNILKLKNVKVKEIMTPRVVLATADENLNLKEFLNDKEYLNFSRIPIFAEESENITGYVLRQEVFEQLAEGENDRKLKDLKHNILTTPNNTVLFSLWEKFLENKEHIALIVDEYGGVDGIVSMEDIIETLLGLEIMDEKDTVTDMQKYARERWKTRQAKYEIIDKVKQEKTDKPPATES